MERDLAPLSVREKRRAVRENARTRDRSPSLSSFPFRLFAFPLLLFFFCFFSFSFYHLASRLHLPIDEADAEDVDAFRSAPGAALPENGLTVRLFISEKERRRNGD